MSKRNDIVMVAVKDIQSDDAWNPRRDYGEEVENDSGFGAMDDLKKSIQKQGLLQPIVVRPLGADDDGVESFALVAGFRRFRAVLEIGMATVPATVIDAGSDAEALVVNITENVQRKTLSPGELAIGLARLSEEGDMSGSVIARRVGLSRGHVNNLIRLRQKASAPIWQRFTASKITMQQALKCIGAGESEEEQTAKLMELLGLEKSDGDGDGDTGEKEKEKKGKKEKKGPSKAEIERVVQYMREATAGRAPAPKGWTEKQVRATRDLMRWVIGERKTLPFAIPRLDD